MIGSGSSGSNHQIEFRSLQRIWSHVGYMVEGIWKPMRRHDWVLPVLASPARKRDEEAVAVRRLARNPGVGCYGYGEPPHPYAPGPYPRRERLILAQAGMPGSPQPTWVRVTCR